MRQLANLDAVPGITHAFFSRHGGVSSGLFTSLNASLSSGDDRERVLENRRRCAARLLYKAPLVTPRQVHGIDVVHVKQPWPMEEAPAADAVVTRQRGLAIGVITADCAPVLFADTDGNVVGAAHAGWRGAFHGVLEAVVEAMEAIGARRQRIVAGIGPTIGPASYEVGEEFRQRFLDADGSNHIFFQETGLQETGLQEYSLQEYSEQPHFDLPGYVLHRLGNLGLGKVEAGGWDTCADDDFFSYRRSCHRREPSFGCQLSAIVLDP